MLPEAGRRPALTPGEAGFTVGFMFIRLGYELTFEMPQPSAMLVMLYLHPGKAPALQRPERILVEPETPVEDFVDWFGNRVARILAPAGQVRIRYDNVVEDSGRHEPQMVR
jgi:transglutaminase-like putative cysteine protease